MSKEKPFVSVIIIALNEEAAIGSVIHAVPKDLADEIVVVDNGSKDRTAEVARAAGARVVNEPIPGYGRAFRAGLRNISPECEIVVFLDGDGSDCPEMMDRLVGPINKGTADFVIGSRTQGTRERGSMNFHQVIAGYMVGFVLHLLYGVRSTDMGPFRAIRRETLDNLGLREETYGWPLEMQMRAAQARVPTIEVPVDYRRRAGGHSKIAGTIRGSFLAASRILFTLARLAIYHNKDRG
jgi:glycosyltransferase involved in cell wall biosynthesis